MTVKSPREALSKVPAVTLGFWIIKILATTLGETGGDSVTMTWLGETTRAPGAQRLSDRHRDLRRAAGRPGLGADPGAKRFNPWLYWATIVASTTCGTTLADFADRSLGIGYPGGSLLLLGLRPCLAVRLAPEPGHDRRQQRHRRPRAETFYWITITFSQTLGTALGDWIADAGLGYSGGAIVFGAALAVLAVLYFTTRHQPRRPVLGGVHPDPAVGRDGRRFPRQADRQGRPRIQPSARLGGPRGGDYRFDPASPATAGRPPGEWEASLTLPRG